MPNKRTAPEAEHSHPERQAKKPKKGFSVGPANLPDGTHRRKGTEFPRTYVNLQD